MRLRITGLMTALFAALAAAPAAAQLACAPASSRTDSAAATPARPPDVLIVATASIAQLRFESEPRTQVRATGCPGAESVVTTQRQNLPDPVQPGVTYRDVRVGVEIRAWLNVECLPAMAAADPALCAPVSIETNVTPPAGQPAPANPPGR
jgi:hypothetical protein